MCFYARAKLAILHLMTLLDELHLIVSQFRYHLLQEYPQQCVQARKVPPKPVQPAPLPPKKETKAIVETKAFEPKVVEEIKPQHPLLSALCRPFVHPTLTPLIDCLEKFEKAHIACLAAPNECVQKDFGYPKLLFISFFAYSSQEAEFLQKVAVACDTKLAPSTIYHLPQLEMAAQVHTICATGTSKAVVLAYDSSVQHKMASWLSYFGVDLQQEVHEMPPLISKKALFGVPFFELLVPSTQDPSFKSALWKALQQTI